MSWRDLASAEETRHDPQSALPPHRHLRGYLALVLDGGYAEISVDGRFAARAGTLIAHPPYHFHGNSFGRRGARVLNLPWMEHFADIRYGAVRVEDPDLLARLVERDPVEAAVVAGEALRQKDSAVLPESLPSWLERLATALRNEVADATCEPIGATAKELGVSAEHAARRFKHFFGASPVRYRREHRVRKALALLGKGRRPADVAAHCGFADQSHLTREIRKATGRTPAAWCR